MLKVICNNYIKSVMMDLLYTKLNTNPEKNNLFCPEKAGSLVQREDLKQ